MKKIVAAILILTMFFFCGCTQNTSGSKYELLSNSWAAELEGGGEVFLKFNEDTAELKIKNCGLETEIKGKFLADDNSFIIFVPEIFRNYLFEYQPMGDTLRLTYENSSEELELKKENS